MKLVWSAKFSRAAKKLARRKPAFPDVGTHDEVY